MQKHIPLLGIGLLLLAACSKHAPPLTDEAQPSDSESGSADDTDPSGSDGSGTAGDNDAGTADPGDTDAAAPRAPKGPPGSVWMTSGGNAKIMHFDAAYEELVAVFDVGDQPTAIAHGAGYIWYTRNGQAELERVDENGNVEVTDALGARDVYFDGTELWCTTSEFVLAKVDPVSGAAVQHFELDEAIDDPVLGVAGAAWVMAGHSLLRVDGASEETSAVDLSELTGDLDYGLTASAYADGQLWFAIFSESGPGYLVQVDEAERSLVGSLEFPSLAHDDGVAVGFGAVWLSSEGASKVFRIDPATLSVVQEYEVAGGHPQDLEVGAGSVWFVDMPGSKLWRLMPDDGSLHSIELAYPPSDLVVSLD